MQVAVLIAPIAAMAIAAEYSARSGSHCAHRTADDRSDRTAHRSSGDGAARRAYSLRRGDTGAQGKEREHRKRNFVHDAGLLLAMTSDDVSRTR
jgi:hypothetical protein